MAFIKTFTEWKQNRTEAKALEAKKEAKAKYSAAVKELLKEFEVAEVHEIPADKRKDFYEKLDTALSTDQELKEAYELAFDTLLTEGADPQTATDVIGSEGPTKDTDDVVHDKKAADADDETGKTVIESDGDDDDDEDGDDDDKDKDSDDDDGDSDDDDGDSDDDDEDGDDEDEDDVEEGKSGKDGKKKTMARKKARKAKMTAESSDDDEDDSDEDEDEMEEGKSGKDGKKKTMDRKKARKAKYMGEAVNDQLANDFALYIENTESSYKHMQKIVKKVSKMGGDEAQLAEHIEKALPGLYKSYQKAHSVSDKLDNDTKKAVAGELAERMAEELTEAIENGKLIDLFINAEVSESVTDETKSVIREVLEGFEAIEAISDMLLGESGNMEIQLVSGKSLAFEVSESTYALKGEESAIIEATDSENYLNQFSDIFESMVLVEESAILPNPEMDETSKKIYDSIKASIEGPVNDEGDKKSDDVKEGADTDDSVTESKEDEIAEMMKEMKKHEMYAEMSDEDLHEFCGMAYEMKHGIKEAGCDGVKEYFGHRYKKKNESSGEEEEITEAYKCEGDMEGAHVTGIMPESFALRYKGKKEGDDAGMAAHIDVDGDGVGDIDASEMKASKIAEMIKEYFGHRYKSKKESVDTDVDDADLDEGIKVSGNKKLAKAIKAYQDGDMSWEDFQKEIMAMDEAADPQTAKDVIGDKGPTKDTPDVKTDTKAADADDETGKTVIEGEQVDDQTGKDVIDQNGTNPDSGDVKHDKKAADSDDDTGKTVIEGKVNEQDVKDEESFRSYATEVLKSAFGEEFSQERADSVINGLINKYGEKGDWGAAVGALQAGLAD